MPGIDDAGSGSPSIWALFPPWAQRAFWWLLVVGVLLALWRGRRLGPVVTEPLPVVVRSAEVVEGHGRLYRRAGARERAAELLRAGHRDPAGAPRLGLDRRAGAGRGRRAGCTGRRVLLGGAARPTTSALRAARPRPRPSVDGQVACPTQ